MGGVQESGGGNLRRCFGVLGGGRRSFQGGLGF